jgi:hypothetical protein
MPEKLRLENPGQKQTDTSGKSRPSGARKGKAGKSRQVTTDTAGKFGCQYLQIQPENPGK